MANWWRRLLGRQTSDSDLEEELEAHVAIETKQLMERGLSRDQAANQARRLFGNQTLVLEVSREVNGHGSLARFGQDLRYAARVLRRGPAFTVAAVLSLALGIGATTAVFSIADTIFLRPLPYADADRLVWVAIRFPSIGSEFVPSPDYVAWRRDNRVFQQLAATQAGAYNFMVLGGPDPAEVRVARVSANFLDAFAAAPAFGRTFSAEEELPNGPKAVLLTNQFWRGHFQSRHDVLGSSITLDGQPYTIAGILPQSFVYPVDVHVDLLTTLPVSPTASHSDRSISIWAVFGRLKPGVTLAQARADMDALFATSRAADTQMFRADNSVVLQPLQEHRVGNVRSLVFILIGAVTCLLAIACANVANLLLARWSARARELAVRAAVGAGRGRLARQLFTEVALLIAAGAAVGLIFVTAALRGFVHFAAGEFPRLSEVTTDFRVFGIALLVSVATALIFGGLPALRAGRIDLQSVLQQAGRSGVVGGHRLMRRVFVVLEVALSVVLLSGAALLFETLWHLQNDHLGFRPEHILTLSIPVRGPSLDPTGRQALASDVLADLSRIPGTEAAALTQCIPLSLGAMSVTFSRSDRPLPDAFHRGDNIGVCNVGPEYHKAAASRLVQGRFLTEADYDRPGTVAMINEAAARAYFPGESPLGKQILGGRVGRWKTVVGVVADTKNQGLNQAAVPQAFVNEVSQTATGNLFFIVRTLATDGAFARALRELMRTGHPGYFTKIETLDRIMNRQTASPRFNTVLLSTFAAVAFLMAIVGVYGVLAFSVTQRSEEIGIRMALGATPGGVLVLVMKEGAALVGVGAIAGLAGALISTRYLATLLYGVKATDVRTYAAVVIGLTLAAALASFVPARRAARLDPVEALHHE
ncbi:MAG TPA: ABC transporter permease [Bryobacteraceae bacterium]|nr:ABC transporter permease [Bryobacteraceae bacterium]